MDTTCDVVIATKNRPEALRRCLTSLVEQSDERFGVIVVDDCGDQPLDDVVFAPAFASLRLRLERLTRPSGPAAARNAGVALSDADYVVFLDDDVAAHWRLIETHLSIVTSPGPDGTPVVSCGPFVEPADWTPTPWNKWEAVQARKEADDLTQGVYEVTWRQFHTGNNCLPTALFRAVGGFDESFTRAEDDELARRLERHGCTFRFEPAAVAWHYPHRSLPAWLRIPRAYATHDVRIDEADPEAGYLATKRRELSQRHPAIRAARWLLLRPGLSRAGVAGWVLLARGLYRVGLVRPAMGALSAAYDLSYLDELTGTSASRELATAGR